MNDSDDKKPIVSNAMMQFLQARLMEILGLVLLAISAILLVSLITAGKSDPSVALVSDEPVSNWLGSIGANISAVLYMVLGLGAFALAVVPLFWGLGYLRKEPVPNLRWRIGLLPLCLLLIAGGLFALDGGGVSDNGGAVGAVAVGFVMRWMQPLPDFMGLETIHYVGAVFAFFGLLSLSWLLAISRAGWARATAAMGRIGDFLTPVQRLGRQMASGVAKAAPSGPKPAPKKAAKQLRREPVLVAGAGDAADVAPSTVA